MKYEIIEPPKILQKYVRYFSTLDYESLSDSANQIKVFADRYPHLVFQHHGGRSAFYKNGHSLPTTFISGIKTKPYTCDVHSIHSATNVTFYPHAIKALFGMDAYELNDELPEIENFAPKYLNDLLLNTEGHSKRIKILVDFLSKKLHNLESGDLLLKESMKLVSTYDESTLGLLGRHFKISERQLERRFKSSIGLSPKQFLRTTRFEKALRLIGESKFKNLSDIAYHLNFTDQSHFIKDFKEFSGFTPKAYLNQNKALEDSSTSLIPEDGIITLNHLITY
jgi:AraC-like DNA-binding protein